MPGWHMGQRLEDCADLLADLRGSGR